MARKKQDVLPYYKYKEKRFAGRGIAAIIFGVISILVFAALTFLGINGMMSNAALFGAVGIVGFAIAFIGMLEGLASFRDDCKSYLPSKIGTLICGFLVAGWFLIFCLGLSA